jgi:hypothetical protein
VLFLFLVPGRLEPCPPRNSASARSIREHNTTGVALA